MSNDVGISIGLLLFIVLIIYFNIVSRFGVYCCLSKKETDESQLIIKKTNSISNYESL